MIPSDEKKEEGFRERPSVGMRLASNPFPNKQGVYEMRVVPPGAEEKDSVVIYLGKAGGIEPGNKSSLRQRMNQYMQNGSHKKELYDALLRGGCKIQVRVASASIGTRRTNSFESSKKIESHFLSKNDYAANKMENGNTRFNEITLKVNGKPVKMDKFLEMNGYKEGKKKTKGKYPYHMTSLPPFHTAASARTLKTARSTTTTTTTTIGHRRSSSSEPRIILKKDGTPDRRYKNKTTTNVKKDNTKTITSTFTGTYAPVITKKDGTSDMRYKANKINVTPPTVSPPSLSVTSVCTGPLKKDGTPDMRYSSNKTNTYASTTKSAPSYSSSTYSSSSSSSSNSYSSYATSRLGSYGGFDVPLTNSGMPDMRFSVCKSLFS
jgi:hypothetical protein